MDEIIDYLANNFEKLSDIEIDQQIINKLNKLNRRERGRFRELLFNKARTLGNNGQSIEWLQACFQLLDKYTFRFNNVYFSPGHEIKSTIASMLHEAQSTVDLCIFTITDNELCRQITNCQRRKVKVRIITDDEKTDAKGSVIHRLVKAGIPVKIDHSHYHMHNKFGIIDRRIAITGSFNWTYTATKHNQENLLATSNFDIVKQYQEEFNRLWKEMFFLK